MPNEENISKQTAGNLFTRDFVLGFLAYFAFLFACFALVPTLPIYLARLGSNEREIGVLVGIFSVSSLVSRLLVGGALYEVLRKKCHDICALCCLPLPSLPVSSFAPFGLFLL